MVACLSLLSRELCPRRVMHQMAKRTIPMHQMAKRTIPMLLVMSK